MQVTTTPKRVERTDKSEYVSLIDQTGHKNPKSSWNAWKIAKTAALALFVIATVAAVAIAGVRMSGGGSSSSGSGSVVSKSPLVRADTNVVKADADAYYDEDLAERLLKISYSTYCDEDEIKSWSCHYCEQVKEFEFKEVIVYSDIKVIFGYDNATEHMVAAFSGGTALLNFLIWSWMPALPTDFCDDCRAQAGIIDAYLDIQTELEAAMETYSNEYPGVDWHFTGYDWGGSSASYAALKFLNYFDDNDNDATIELYTFGQTRWCNKNLAKYFKSRVKKHWRVTNQRDLYVNQPLAMLGYKHTGKTVWYRCAYADDDGEFDYVECDSEGDCAPLRPSVADHEVYIGNQFGCTDDELNTDYQLSQCDSYIIANEVLPAIIDEQDEDDDNQVDCVRNCDEDDGDE